MWVNKGFKFIQKPKGQGTFRVQKCLLKIIRPWYWQCFMETFSFCQSTLSKLHTYILHAYIIRAYYINMTYTYTYTNILYLQYLHLFGVGMMNYGHFSRMCHLHVCTYLPIIVLTQYLYLDYLQRSRKIGEVILTFMLNILAPNATGARRNLNL